MASNPALSGVVQQDTILTTNTRQVPPDANPLVNFADFDVRYRVVRSDSDATMIFAPRILFGRNVTSFPLLVNRVDMWGFADFAVSGGCAPRGIQLDGWKFQGIRSSMRLLGWPFAIASSVALR